MSHLLHQVAKKYLCPPPSTCSSEREFSAASDVANGDRNRLLGENVDKLVFLKYNLRSIGYESFDLM